jgi:hypothetical protein
MPPDLKDFFLDIQSKITVAVNRNFYRNQLQDYFLFRNYYIPVLRRHHIFDKFLDLWSSFLNIPHKSALEIIHTTSKT